LQTIVQQEARKIRENLENFYENEIKNNISIDFMPLDENLFYKKHR